jgi:hypothetical protein
MLRHFAAGLLLPPLLALAAAAPSTHAQTPAPRGPVTINEQTLTSFAEAHLNILEIDADRARRARAVQDPQQIARIEQEADSAIQRALAEREMTREDYEAIDELIGTDAEIRQEFDVILARVRQSREFMSADTLYREPTRSPGSR